MKKNNQPSSNVPQPMDLPGFAGERLHQIPFSLRIILENALRHSPTDNDAALAVEKILDWQPNETQRSSVPFYPSRVLLQDLTGVPLVVDLAAMRNACTRLGGDPALIAPRIPVDLVIDHSLQVDFTNPPDAFEKNIELEYERNLERYQLLRWAQDAFSNFRVVPPGKGIVHQINLESLATVITQRLQNGQMIKLPDTLVGTDSHTPMINGLGVLGWGVGGIEAIAAMLGKPIELVLPDVIGLALEGQLPDGATPTDLTLTIVERLRSEGVVGTFIECFGNGLDNISIPDRAMIANMSPESGATVTFFPVDEHTLAYLRLTGRSPKHIEQVEHYCKTQGLFRQADTPAPQFSRLIRMDLSQVTSSLAGPSRPQDRVTIPNLKPSFQKALKRGRLSADDSIPVEEKNQAVKVTLNNQTVTLKHGALLIAAITSCTNTSNPMVMLSTGLLAQKATARGLQVNPTVKCSLMPGSRVVTAYLKRAGLLEPLATLGFNLVGYGCGSCIGNSGPLAPEVVKALREQPLMTASISSGNRNFEGRIHPQTRANYLASPPLIVAYALAGTVNIDLKTERLGIDKEGCAVYLKDLFPTQEEVQALLSTIQPKLFKHSYADLFQGDQNWQSIYPGQRSTLYPWDRASTYIQEPPYFQNLSRSGTPSEIQNINNARTLAFLGDSITTDHISPAGHIPLNSPAGNYLLSLGVREKDFNTYGARRGNDQVMVRGTFANTRLKNALVPDVEGGFTRHLPHGNTMPIFDAAQRYHNEDVPLIILAGKEYGTGSSRDWAAKGPLLLGVRAVIAESFERIHRANLVGMGVLPLQFKPGQNAKSLGLTGEESYTLMDLNTLSPNSLCQVQAQRDDGTQIYFTTIARVDTIAELHSFRMGGILHETLYQSIKIHEAALVDQDSPID
jgi:aconitate hydratase